MDEPEPESEPDVRLSEVWGTRGEISDPTWISWTPWNNLIWIKHMGYWHLVQRAHLSTIYSTFTSENWADYGELALDLEVEEV